MTALSATVIALAMIAAGGGLLSDDLYRDNPFVRAAWHGADLITLMVTVPILAGAMAMAARGSITARLLWLGMLACLTYAAFNAFFLIYVALFAASGWALAIGLASLDVSRITSSRAFRTRRLWVAGYMVIVAAGLTTVYVAQSIAFVKTGDVLAVRAGFDDAANELPLWMVLAAGHAAATIATIHGLRDGKNAPQPAPPFSKPRGVPVRPTTARGRR